jgi:fructose-1-phosphate kinase PfkB-like protein
LRDHCRFPECSGGYAGNEKRSYSDYTTRIKVKSTVGAGDSMVAGIVFLPCQRGDNIETASQYGVSLAALPATLNAGTELCLKKDVEALFNPDQVNCPISP